MGSGAGCALLRAAASPDPRPLAGWRTCDAVQPEGAVAHVVLSHLGALQQGGRLLKLACLCCGCVGLFRSSHPMVTCACAAILPASTRPAPALASMHSSPLAALPTDARATTTARPTAFAAPHLHHHRALDVVRTDEAHVEAHEDVCQVESGCVGECSQPACEAPRVQLAVVVLPAYPRVHAWSTSQAAAAARLATKQVTEYS